MPSKKITKRLEYLRGELRAERISYAGLHELQSLADYIEADDVELLEAAGVPEFQPESMLNVYTLDFSAKQWEEIDSIVNGLFPLDKSLTRRQWWAVGQMALGKAQLIADGFYSFDDLEEDDPTQADELRAIATVIFDKFKPGDGQL